jgi:hypothetical protein
MRSVRRWHIRCEVAQFPISGQKVGFVENDGSRWAESPLLSTMRVFHPESPSTKPSEAGGNLVSQLLQLDVTSCGH